MPALGPQAGILFLRLVSRRIQLKGCRSGMNDAENGLDSWSNGLDSWSDVDSEIRGQTGVVLKKKESATGRR